MRNSLPEAVERFNKSIRTITDLLADQDPVTAQSYLYTVALYGQQTIDAVREITTGVHRIVDESLKNAVTLITPAGKYVTSAWKYLPETDEFSIRFDGSKAKEEKPCPTCR